jgi:transposase
MNKLNTIGVDLAKIIIQISLVSAHGKELQNKALTRKKFAEFLGQQKSALVAFEACATAKCQSGAAEEC